MAKFQKFSPKFIPQLLIHVLNAKLVKHFPKNNSTAHHLKQFSYNFFPTIFSFGLKFPIFDTAEYYPNQLYTSI